MTGACAAAPASGGYIGSISRFIDCRAEILDTSAFGALAAPGSTLSLLLTGFLTIFVALIGYNLLIGRGFGLRSGTIAMVKVGAVLTLVTSWPAYQTLIYDVVIDGPGQIASEIGRPGGLPGSDGTLLQRLDAADGALQQLAVLGTGNIDFSVARTLPPPPMVGFDAFALGGSRILFLITALVGIVSVRIVAALMLALGPYCIAFLLFENTKSIFEGWVRVLAGAALAAVGMTITLGLELALLEPWLSDVLARRAAGETLPTMPTELFVTMCFFAAIALASALASIKLAAAFRLARPKRAEAVTESRSSQSERIATLQRTSDGKAAEQPSRAALTASVIASLQQRETAGRAMPADIRVVSHSLGRAEGDMIARSSGHVLPTGRAFPRRTRMRATASAGRRDRTS